MQKETEAILLVSSRRFEWFDCRRRNRRWRLRRRFGCSARRAPSPDGPDCNTNRCRLADWIPLPDITGGWPCRLRSGFGI